MLFLLPKQLVPDLEDLLHSLVLLLPLRLELVQLDVGLDQVLLHPGHLTRLHRVTLLQVSGHGRALTLEDLDRALEIEQRGRLRLLGDGDPGGAGVEQVDGLVGQQPPRDVAVAEPDRGHHGVIADADLVALLVVRGQAAHHGDGLVLRRLLDLDQLESAGQRGVLLEVFLVLRPGRGGQGPQLPAGQGGLEQVRGVAAPGGPAGSDHGVGLVDEEDDRLG